MTDFGHSGTARAFTRTAVASTLLAWMLAFACAGDGEKTGGTDGGGANGNDAGSAGTAGNMGTSGSAGKAESGGRANGSGGGAGTPGAGGNRPSGGGGPGGTAGRPGSGGGGGNVSGGAAGDDGGTPSGGSLSTKYPGDVGIETDPAVLWTENFEESTLSTFFARYDDSKQQGLAFDADVPAKSSGKSSAKLTAAGAGPNAVDFFKRLPDSEEVFVRYYAKYESNVPWHHTGVWIGGYNPGMKYPSPMAGLQPKGDDRFSVSLEPLEQGALPRMDFYNYWMKMHSWMDMPMGDTAYYGNPLIHEPSLVAKATWQCIEVHVRLNPNATSGAGAELGVWVDDSSVAQFTDSAPLGYWIKDKFCPDKATGTECTMYRPANPTLAPLDLQYRSTTALKINAFWPQNYITDPGSGSVYYDDMIVAKSRIGCLH